MTVVLIAGEMSVPDRLGHHDYVGGCNLLAHLLEQTPGVRTKRVDDGWPTDERVFDIARTVVLYSGGGRKHPFVANTARWEKIERLAGNGVGFVLLHQAVSFPPESADRALPCIGGVHVRGESRRGHWPTFHRTFPAHAVTRGVRPWETTDGWLTQIRFVNAMKDVVPLVWSGEQHRGSPLGGTDDIASWAYEREDIGRTFCFTGLDAHSAWALPGLRQLVVNGILWSAGLPIPDNGASCQADATAVNSCITPRGSSVAMAMKSARYFFRRLAR